MNRLVPLIFILITLMLSSCAKDKLKPLSIEARKELLRPKCSSGKTCAEKE